VDCLLGAGYRDDCLYFSDECCIRNGKELVFVPNAGLYFGFPQGSGG
jgi:hypothetical protein